MKRPTLEWGFVLGLGLATACGSSAGAPSEAPPPTPIVPPPTVAPSPSPPPPPSTPVAPPSGSGASGLGSLLGPDESAWHACTADADCVLVRAPCGGNVAGNRAHAEELQRSYDALARTTECARSDAPAPVVEPACEGSLCVARPVLGGLGASGVGVGGS
ncbi:MAG: hypothetical protein U0234_18675 [Sandaracinus sp.]